jgi:hypothetical protein
MARRRSAKSAFAIALLALAAPAQADLGARLEAEAWWGLRTQELAVSLARFTAVPSIRPALSESLTLDVRGRLELAPDRTGLGTRDTYAPWSRPLLLTDAGRLELDRAVLQLRTGTTRITLGKQAVAWGVLDGLQAADRFDPVRRRDFVATDLRPERIGRWAGRIETEVGRLRIDAVLAPDPTVNQQAGEDDAFALSAPRFRAGLPVGGQSLPRQVDRRDRALEDATYGLRLAAGFGGLDTTILAFRGPETDPLLLPGGTESLPAIRLAFPHRTVIGATAVLPSGATVWRLEMAHIPDQPLNLDAARLGRLEVVRRPRTIAGLGVDWQAPARLFVNAQLVVDHVAAGGALLARPGTDVIATLRVHRDLARDTVRLRTEVLADLGRGDALLRPAIDWKADDRLTLAGGADLFAGPADGIFGQFRQQSRLWLRARTAF